MFEDELRRYLLANNGPSFDRLTDEVLEAVGADPVFEGPQATGGTVYQYSQPAGVELIDGKWYTKHVLGPVFTDTTDEQGNVTTAAQHEAAYKARKDAEQAKGVREERSRKLAESDWTRLDDNGLSVEKKSAWAAYRQALRDVPSQPGFPWSVNWPSTPSP
jgi:hypothetical protein